MRSSWRQWRLTLCNTRSLPKNASCREFQVTNVHFMQDVLRNWQMAKVDARDRNINNPPKILATPKISSNMNCSNLPLYDLVIFLKIIQKRSNVTSISVSKYDQNLHIFKNLILKFESCIIDKCWVHPWTLLILMLLRVCGGPAWCVPPTVTRPIAALPIAPKKLSASLKRSNTGIKNVIAWIIFMIFVYILYPR